MRGLYPITSIVVGEKKKIGPPKEQCSSALEYMQKKMRSERKQKIKAAEVIIGKRVHFTRPKKHESRDLRIKECLTLNMRGGARCGIGQLG